jgi:hypothetical protein
MARPKSPDGKSTLLAFKISQRQKAAYDAARGDLKMADWARSVLDGAASGGGRDAAGDSPVSPLSAQPAPPPPPEVVHEAIAWIEQNRPPQPEAEEAGKRYACCRHCGHGGAKGHDDPCLKCARQGAVS